MANPGKGQPFGWDLGDDANFMLACKEQELDDNIAYEKAKKEEHFKSHGQTPDKKEESFNECGWIPGHVDVDDENESYKHDVKARASFSAEN